MPRNLWILAVLAAVVGLPFALRPKDSLLARADETLVIVTPHNEAIRAEFARGFREWHQARTGRTARLDWRIPGGTSEIARYLASEYEAPFEQHWKTRLGRPWTAAAQRAFDDPKVVPGPDAGKDTEAEAARRAFLASEVGIGTDLFFGGGSFDFVQQANAGRLVDSGFVGAHPELFNESNIPQTLGGEPYYDKQGRWFGNVLSAFGICYNLDAMERLKAPHDPTFWDDLGEPVYFGEVALADPNKSGSVAKAFEMVVQEQIQATRSHRTVTWESQDSFSVRTTLRTPFLTLTREGKDREDGLSKSREAGFVSQGWTRAMRLIQKLSANARYFTDSATKVPIDIAQGDAAVGMAIDFYGRFESENARNASGHERMRFRSPSGGTSYGVDPIGLLRGAPHRELALAFMEYVMSLEGQKLWNWQVGAPGGPKQYALRRLPIRRELYSPEFKECRSDPEVFPYEEAKNFTYHPEWTAALFNPLRFIVRVMCVDPHEEARAAWDALIQAGFPSEATRAFEDVSAVSYDEAKGRLASTLRDPDKLAEARLAAELTERFRAQYRRAAELARAGK